MKAYFNRCEMLHSLRKIVSICRVFQKLNVANATIDFVVGFHVTINTLRWPNKLLTTFSHVLV